MALFQRSKSPFVDDEPGTQGPPSSETPSVADMLRQRRMTLDIDLSDVAAALKIKPGYLSAIEEGRSDRLPGAIYALGFVRSYSEYLGLDSAAVLQRFKIEAAGLNAKPNLTFPLPLSERSLPSGGVLTAAVLLAVCGYAAWFHLTVSERTGPERVTELPPGLLSANLGLDNKAKVITDTPPARPGALAPRLEADSKLLAPGRLTAAQVEASGITQGVASAGSGPVTTGAASVGHPGPSSPTATPAMAATSLKAEAVGASPVSGMAATSVGHSGPSGPLPSAAAGSSAPEAAPAGSQGSTVLSEALASAQSPSLAGAAEAPSRITIRAKADSWIQIRAADRSVLYTGVLKSGDVYRVPDREGLTMRAGNAGGLEIVVDGKPRSSLGPMGAVRNLSLDPHKLTGEDAAHD